MQAKIFTVMLISWCDFIENYLQNEPKDIETCFIYNILFKFKKNVEICTTFVMASFKIDKMVDNLLDTILLIRRFFSNRGNHHKKLNVPLLGKTMHVMIEFYQTKLFASKFL